MLKSHYCSVIISCLLVRGETAYGDYSSSPQADFGANKTGFQGSNVPIPPTHAYRVHAIRISSERYSKKELEERLNDSGTLVENRETQKGYYLFLSDIIKTLGFA